MILSALSLMNNFDMSLILNVEDTSFVICFGGLIDYVTNFDMYFFIMVT